jgi:ParB/RepB/Spo0J family partition protein
VKKESLMATQKTSSNGNGNGHPRAELRLIPLSRIVVQDGFNPRGEVVEDDALEAMAATMRERGCLQSVRVRATDTDEFQLVAGERRYRAAALAALTEIPAMVLPAGAGDEAEQLELLTDAVIENEMRSDLDPLQRALGFQAMLDCGLNVRGVAERLGGKAKRTSRERRVKAHLAILTLPEDLREKIANETIPVMAVKVLSEINKISTDLARAAVAAVLDVEEHYEPYTWAEIVEEGLAVAVRSSEPLPAGMFQSSQSYPIATFTLGEKASKDLAAHEKIAGVVSLDRVFFTPELVEQARVLGAVHELGRSSALIVGQDVGDRLAEDYIAQNLKAARANARRRRAEQQDSDPDAQQSGTGSGSGEQNPEQDTPEQRAERAREKAKAEREAQQEERVKATAFNELLGLLVFKHLPKIKVDERVLRILASVNLGGELWSIAARGARLALPGWVTQTTTASTGKTKTVYLDTHEAGERAERLLQVACSAGDIAGRSLTLIALASLVDEEHALAFSNRSHHELRLSGPWAAQAQRDLNAIVRERIKEGQLPALDAILDERIAKDAQDAAHDAEVNHALLRLDGVIDRREQIALDELEQAIVDAELAWGKYALNTHTLRAELDRRSSSEDEDGEPHADEAEQESAAAAL